MQKIRVEVQNDHLLRLTKVRRPVLAIAELVWNALDADAETVAISIVRNDLGGVDAITVEDDGHGISHSEAVNAFGSLGGSWKTSTMHTRSKKRLLHGQAGKGRFRAYSVGSHVRWVTRSKADGNLFEFSIRGASDDLGTFEISDPTAVDNSMPGTLVRIEAVNPALTAIDVESAWVDLTTHFAPYLKMYPDVSISIEGKTLDPEKIQLVRLELPLPPIALGNGQPVEAQLEVIEWSIKLERALCLCDANGFTLAEIPPGIQAPGFYFTAYLRSELLRDLEEEHALVLGEAHPDLKMLLDPTKDALRTYFRERAASNALSVIEGWKKEKSYPYEGEPTSIVEKAEREVFDVLAFNVNSYLPNFDQADVRSRRLSFRLLREALVESPQAVRQIISEVLELPTEKLEELAELLERTSLSAIINASREVADRLDYLRSVEILLFEYKKHLLERSQLHHILEDKTWLFGEQFCLSVTDKSLTEVLRKHVKLLERDQLCQGDGEVLDGEGKRCIVDLMFSRLIPQPHAEQREHLVVELKRPAQPVNHSVVHQVERYALAVASDERFRDTDTHWEFWAISNEITDEARKLASQADRPFGLVFESDSPWIRVWVKDWGCVLEECRARLNFFRERLEYSPEDSTALEKLRKLHERYLPASVITA